MWFMRTQLRFEVLRSLEGAWGQWHTHALPERGTDSRPGCTYPISLRSSHGGYLHFLGTGHMGPGWVLPMGGWILSASYASCIFSLLWIFSASGALNIFSASWIFCVSCIFSSSWILGISCSFHLFLSMFTYMLYLISLTFLPGY